MSKPHIALFVRNGLIGNIALNKALPAIFQSGFQPVIFNTGEPYSKKADIPELREIGFLETALLRDVVTPCLKKHDLQSQNGQATPGLCYTNEDLARLYKLDYEIVPDVNDPSFVSRIAADKNIVGSHSTRILQIFHEPLLAAFEEKKNGFVWNTHTGLLPQYKGVHVPYHAIEDGQKVYGWTLHKKERGIDTGEILDLDWLELDPQKPVLMTYLDMVPKGAKMLANVLSQYVRNGNVASKRQPVFMSKSYYTHPTSIQMQRHEKNGVRFATDAETVDIYMRAYAVAGTPQAADLERLLWEAIGERRAAAPQKQAS